MQTRILRVVSIFFILGLTSAMTFATTSCSFLAEEAAEQVVEESTGVEVDKDGENVTITGEDGETLEVSGEGGELPDGFPEDVPTYSGEIQSSTSFSAGDGQNFSVAIVTDDAFDDVVAWYKGEFASAGWEVMGETIANVDGSSTAVLAYSKGDLEAGVTIGEDSETGSVNIIHSVSQP